MKITVEISVDDDVLLDIVELARTNRRDLQEAITIVKNAFEHIVVVQIKDEIADKIAAELIKRGVPEDQVGS